MCFEPQTMEVLQSISSFLADSDETPKAGETPAGGSSTYLSQLTRLGSLMPCANRFDTFRSFLADFHMFPSI